MNLSLSQKKKKKQATGSKRPLLSEEELSDRRSSSSTDSTAKQRKVNDLKCQRTRKTSKKNWKDTFDYLDCQFSGSATDEDWNEKTSLENSSDSDPAWSPLQSHSNSPAPPKLTLIQKPISSVELECSSNPEKELMTENIEEDLISSPSLSELTVIKKTKVKKTSKTSKKSKQKLEVTKGKQQCSVFSPSLLDITKTVVKPKQANSKKYSKKLVLESEPAMMALEDHVVISSTAPTNQPTSNKKKKKSSKEPLDPLTPQTDSTTIISKEICETPTSISTTCESMDESPSFAGIISHNASLLEKGFDSGRFIMLKSDFKTQKSPCIWRIDGKNLLQKYEPISHKDGCAYRNISTYSSWMATNKGLYVPIEVEFSVQSKSETIVTFDRNKVMLPVEDGMMETLNEEANSLLDTFQIYLQTLISQSLDSNFVKEIVKEQDEYFLTSIAAIEDHWILPKREMLKGIIKMKKPFQELLEAHPGLELRCVTSGDKSCDTCGGRNPTRSFEFQPLTYSFDTLDIMEGKPSAKNYRLCLSCTDRVLLYHELFHMRYNLFSCCQTKVKQYDQGDGPAALTLSLADQNWKSLMHRKVLLLLAETQQVVSQHSSDACKAA